MKSKNIFRVLVIDDNEDVINQLTNRVTPQHVIADAVWHVDKVLIPARLDVDDAGVAHLSLETVSRILAECAKPFNLLLLDYGFASPGLQWASLPKDVAMSAKFLEKTKTAADLVEEVEKHLQRSQSESLVLKSNFVSNFKNYDGKIYLYTYTPSTITSNYPNPEARKNKTQNAFKHGKVVLVDTQHELFDNFRYESKYSSDFYAYLITGYLDNVINRELLKHVMVVQRNNLRYVRMIKSGAGVFIIAMVAGGVGSASAWVGEAVLNLFKANNPGAAWTLLTLGFVVLVLFGMALPWVLEKFLSNMLTRLVAEDAGEERH